jgi:predicted acylesterase/phospholipase RssA
MENSLTAQGLDYCDPGKKRALVLSGGGLKGAFQAGAIYHLVVHRHCDFREIAGVSVGSLNAAVLAQAKRDENPDASLKNMSERAEKLVDIWQGIHSSKQIFKRRWCRDGCGLSLCAMAFSERRASTPSTHLCI